MSRRLVMALGAALLLAVGGIAAEARPMLGGGGGGGVHMGGMHPGGGPGRGMSGRAFNGNSFRGNSFRGNSFRAGPNVGRMSRGYARRGPVYSRNFDRRHGHHHRGRFIAGYPYFYDYGYGYDGYYGDNCGYYYRRAIATGSPYWWNRYQDCEYAG